jgi:hypothetical protein
LDPYFGPRSADHEGRTATSSHQVSHLYFLTDRLTLWSSRCWEATGSSAGQEIPRILCNPKVHDRAHNRPPSVPLLRHKIPIDALPTYFWANKTAISTGTLRLLKHLGRCICRRNNKARKFTQLLLQQNAHFYY